MDVIQTLLPVNAVAVGSAAGSSGGGATPALLPGEAQLVEHAVAVRRREFAAGRACAHQALALLGRPGVAVLAGPGREPRWPPGIVGSITHCPGYCAAAVAPAGRLLGLGIDAERNLALEPALRRRVAGPSELRAALQSLVGAPGRAVADAALLLFSAKEAFYKAWFPLTGIELDLGDVSVGVDARHGTFEVWLLTPAAVAARPGGATIHGRWAATTSRVYTVATIVRCGGPPPP